MGDDRARAIHEAAHGVVAAALGRRVQILSIEPGPSHGGFASWSLPRFPEHTLDHLAAPYPMMDARLRRALESRIVIALAGSVGEAMHEPRMEGFSAPIEPQECEGRADELARRLTSGERATFERAQTEGITGGKDIDYAERMAFAAIGDPLKWKLIVFLEAVAQEILSRTEHASRLLAVADVLEAERVLSGRAFHALIDERAAP